MPWISSKKQAELEIRAQEIIQRKTGKTAYVGKVRCSVFQYCSEITTTL